MLKRQILPSLLLLVCMLIGAQLCAPSRVLAQAEAPVLLVLGDSLSAGYGLPQGQGWVDLLGRRLREGGYPYRVVNASISGDTTLGGRNRLSSLLRQYRPRFVLIELGANDALRGASLTNVRSNLAQMIQSASAQGAHVLLLGMRIPPNYGSEYARKFHAVYEELAKQHGVALVPFLMDGFADRRELFQSDGIHPNSQAQTLMLDTIWKELGRSLKKPGAG